MARETPSAISLASDNDFRNKTVFAYYARYLPKETQVMYHDKGQWPPGGPEWVLTYRSEMDYQPEPVIHTKAADFKWIETFPYSGTSGWNWYLYRNVRSLPRR